MPSITCGPADPDSVYPWAKSFRKPSIGVQTDETGYPSVSLMVELPISSSSIRHLPRLPAEQFPQTPLQEWFEALSADSPFLSPSPLRTSAFEVKFAPPLFLSSFDACCLSRRPMCPCLFWGSIWVIVTFDVSTEIGTVLQFLLEVGQLVQKGSALTQLCFESLQLLGMGLDTILLFGSSAPLFTRSILLEDEFSIWKLIKIIKRKK